MHPRQSDAMSGSKQKRNTHMSIQLTVDAETYKGLGDQQKLYVEKDGGYVLDIEGGAVSQSAYDELKTANETLTGQVNGPEGKSWQEMFEGSQKANQVHFHGGLSVEVMRVQQFV